MQQRMAEKSNANYLHAWDPRREHAFWTSLRQVGNCESRCNILVPASRINWHILRACKLNYIRVPDEITLVIDALYGPIIILFSLVTITIDDLYLIRNDLVEGQHLTFLWKPKHDLNKTHLSVGREIT